MTPKLALALVATLALCLGCAAVPVDHRTEEIVYEQGKLQKYSYRDDTYGDKQDSTAFREAVDIIRQADPQALPELADLPVPGSSPDPKIRSYSGIIKNNTKYDLVVPSANSDASLVIPAKKFIEYTIWKPRHDLTAYRDGRPFYCLKINAHPNTYPFMCKNYDFIAEIVDPTPPPKAKKFKRKIKRKKDC